MSAVEEVVKIKKKGVSTLLTAKADHVDSPSIISSVQESTLWIISFRQAAVEVAWWSVLAHEAVEALAAERGRLTWNVELAGVDPVEVQVETKTGGFDGDQGEKVDDRNGAWLTQNRNQFKNKF